MVTQIVFVFWLDADKREREREWMFFRHWQPWLPRVMNCANTSPEMLFADVVISANISSSCSKFGSKLFTRQANLKFSKIMTEILYLEIQSLSENQELTPRMTQVDSSRFHKTPTYRFPRNHNSWGGLWRILMFGGSFAFARTFGGRPADWERRGGSEDEPRPRNRVGRNS